MNMSLAHNKTPELWRQFMPRQKEISNRLNKDLFSVQVYQETFDMKQFTTNTLFEMWAAVEVAHFDAVPEGMETFELPGGMYAVFLHKGPANTFNQTVQYIFGVWLPGSEYSLDTRAHFQLMNEVYRPDDLGATE